MLQYIFSLETLWWILLFLYLPCCVGLILVVLLQKGKGVGFAGAFGVGTGSEALFGPRSARTLPQKLTYLAAALFMILALGMSTMAGRIGKGSAPAPLEAVVEGEGLDALFGGTTEAPAEADAPVQDITVVSPEAVTDDTPVTELSVETPVEEMTTEEEAVAVEESTASEEAPIEEAGETVPETPAQ
jgi:preprotein translocase subunit SecG